MVDIFLFALTVGWLTVRTGGLEAGIALHALNNLLAFLLPAAIGQLSGWDDQGGAPWTLLRLGHPQPGVLRRGRGLAVAAPGDRAAQQLKIRRGLSAGSGRVSA